MSQVDLGRALKLIAKHDDLAEFVGPRSAELIAKTEQALGHKLPPQYREFVGRLGAGNFGSFEVYGVIDEDFDHSSVPDGVWLNLKERHEYGWGGRRTCLSLLTSGTATATALNCRMKQKAASSA